jgi:hypothetical protein
MVNRQGRRFRIRAQEDSDRQRAAPSDPAAEAEPPEHAGAGVFLGGILGGILGWLIGVGAVPHPALLPLATAKPLLLTLVLAGAGAIIGGVTGAIADNSAAIANAPTTPIPDAEAHTEGPAAREGDG